MVKEKNIIVDTNAFIAISDFKLDIFSAIKEDCVGDPPGEFIINATAGLFLSENNLSINLLTP